MTDNAAVSPEVPRVRVAVISSVHRWNDTRIFLKQAASLAANGYDVVLVAIGDQPSPFEASGVRVIPLSRRKRALRWMTWLSILRIVITERAVVVHAHDPELFPLVLLLKLIGRKAICDIHEDVAEQVLHKEWLPQFWRAPLSRALKGAQRWLPRLADAVILAEDSYLRNFPPASNVAVIRNFPLLPPHSKQDYRTDVFRMIYVGDVRRVRGIVEYVAITDGLAKRGIPVELRIVGSFADPGEESEIRVMVQRMGLEKRVIFLGRRPPEEIPALLEDCDVGLTLLHPIGNYRESYPTKMFEYMAVGLPVIASQFALWESVLVGNDCGRVVDPLDGKETIEAVFKYWDSQELRERHGRNGRKAVLARYHWGLELPRLIAIYAALALELPQMKKLHSVRKKIEKSLLTRGLPGTIVFAATLPLHLFRKLSPRGQRVHAIETAADEEFDRKYRVNTGDVIPLSNLNLTANNWVFGVQYQAVNPAVDFAEILKGLNIPYKEFIFIDLGSGKGRAVLLASSIPFKKIVGIEFSEKLNHIAEGNVGRWPGEAKRCRQIELICMDAGEYRFPEEPFVLYMYNPFGPPVMERVVENVTEAFRKHPRRIIVVYFTPKHSDLWEGVTFLKRVQVQPGYHVYDTYSGVD